MNGWAVVGVIGFGLLALMGDAVVGIVTSTVLELLAGTGPNRVRRLRIVCGASLLVLVPLLVWLIG